VKNRILQEAHRITCLGLKKGWIRPPAKAPTATDLIIQALKAGEKQCDIAKRLGTSNAMVSKVKAKEWLRSQAGGGE